MCACLQNGVLHNGQQLDSAMNNSERAEKFEAMKMLSGCRALCYDKHQFCAKTMVDTLTVFDISLLNTVV